MLHDTEYVTDRHFKKLETAVFLAKGRNKGKTKQADDTYGTHFKSNLETDLNKYQCKISNEEERHRPR